MKYLIQIIKMSFYDSKEYILNFFGEIFTLPFSLAVISLFWTGILKVNPDILNGTGSTTQRIIFYYITVSSVQYAVSPFWYLNYPVYKDIAKGNMAIYLARPIDYMSFTALKYLGEFFTRLFITGCCLVLVSFLFKDINLSAASIMFFMLVLAEIIFMVFCLQFIIASLAFRTEAIFGIRDLLYEAMYFLGGLVVPLDFLPAWIRKITDFLPFKYIYNYPARVLIGGISPEAVKDELNMIIWMALLFVISRLLFNGGQKRFTANGG